MVNFAEGGDDFFGLFGLKGVGSNIFGIKGEPKCALQNFEVGVVFSYLVISGIKCLLLGQEAPISYDFHLEQADIILLGMRILVHFFGLKVGNY